MSSENRELVHKNRAFVEVSSPNESPSNIKNLLCLQLPAEGLGRILNFPEFRILKIKNMVVSLTMVMSTITPR